MMSVKNKQQTMKNVHLIPTDKPSRLFRSFGKLNIGDYTTERENTQIQNQNIYITSDEEIKEGDWFLNKISMKIYKNIWDDYSNNIDEEKIILTTDVDLIKDGVQAIDDEFLEWFVKNLSCESVETEIVEYGFDEVPICIYKISIPKEEPKQELEKEMFELEQELDIPSHLRWHNSKPKQETQGYICPQTKKQCDDECCVSAEDCHIEASLGVISDCEPPKQETLEEAAEKFAKKFGSEIDSTRYYAFINGAKWQQERMYSYEEVLEQLNLLYGMKNSLVDTFTDENDYITMKWFEQFKKK